MKNIVVANCNEGLNDIQSELIAKYNAVGFQNKEDLTPENLDLIKPDYIFFMHWSWIIPKIIYENFKCVVFHMTDLPFGRGGSPLQNLIIRGFKDTKVSAIKVDHGIDTGDIYLKRDLSLEGTATAIFKRTGAVMKEMIDEILSQEMTPVKQEGNPVHFKRRTPDQSIISDELGDIEGLYNFIRMLDAEGYPHAFLENEHFRFEFTNGEIKSEQELTANVRIIKK
ncbi:formyltransferase family protein [Pedobacter gandavensis]|uniref:Methionyl-tRNA formyltransferase n=1 Tax=Pedobacter gandavensis TaxID=2679963 RepID=A0ABR6EXE4_9SPHI|nr:formyltransferase family protein [Pedobacter gandavensis]MBB2149904.1 methionyl-tRNA formyltransferase [Pedobacter gandavensis]